MRTSNKILIGLFVATLLVPTIIFTTLASRIKSGTVVKVNEAMQNNVLTQTFQGVRYVSVRNLYFVTIYPSDTLRTETENRKDLGIRFKREGDSLVIYADQAVLDKDRGGNKPYAYDYLKLYLPGTLDTISLTDCEAIVHGAKDVSKAANYNFSLQGTSLNDYNETGPSSDSLYFGRLFIHARKSSINLPGTVACNDLQLQLESSIFNAMRGIDRYDTLRINADDDSRLNMPARYLNKAILTSKK